MFKIHTDEFYDCLENGLGSDQGDLTLVIACTKCDAEFQLNSEVATMAILTKATFLEYLRYIQSSKCPVCNPEKTEYAHEKNIPI